MASIEEIAGQGAKASLSHETKAFLQAEAKITLDYLAKKLRRELNAKKTTYKKLKGALNDSVLLPRGAKVVAKSSEEVLIAINEIAWGTRQKARIDAHKLRGDYPAEKQDVHHDFAESFVEMLERIHGGNSGSTAQE